MRVALILVRGLTIPLRILYVFCGIVSGVWLGIIGDLGSIGYGVLTVAISVFTIGLALLPSVFLDTRSAYLAERGNIFLCYASVLLSNLYIVFIMAVWCGGILYVFTGRATSHSFIPLLLWSYAVALTPWEWITQKEPEGPGQFFSVLNTVFAQIGYIVMAFLILFARVTIIEVFLTFVIVMVVGVIFQFTLKIQAINATTSQAHREPKTAWDTLQENPLFQQQKALFDAMSLMCEDGVDADELPNGYGEFGLVATNPIPSKTVFGSISYLGRLRASDGTKVTYERICSTSSDVSRHPIDVYQISHPNGQSLGTIYVSPYQKRNSGKAPRGFSRASYPWDI